MRPNDYMRRDTMAQGSSEATDRHSDWNCAGVAAARAGEVHYTLGKPPLTRGPDRERERLTGGPNGARGPHDSDAPREVSEPGFSSWVGSVS
jgi:hypothetical protein